jgi:hypothetical protein
MLQNTIVAKKGPAKKDPPARKSPRKHPVRLSKNRARANKIWEKIAWMDEPGVADVPWKAWNLLEENPFQTLMGFVTLVLAGPQTDADIESIDANLIRKKWRDIWRVTRLCTRRTAM